MNYHEFVRIIEKEVNYNLEGGIRASLHTTIKNNNQERTGLTVQNPDMNIAPTIYLEEFYERYQCGKGIGEIAGEIIRIYEKAKMEITWDPEKLTSYVNIKDKIVFKLINTSQNRELIETLPHIEFLDLCIVFYVLLEVNGKGSATMLVSKEHLTQWKIDMGMLLKTALKNVKRILPAQLYSMTQMVTMMSVQCSEIQENLLEEKPLEQKEDMYILTNPIRSLGAACIVYPGVLKMLGDLLNSDYYVLPSSIHEVILVPDRLGLTFQQMSEMVMEVNEAQVIPEEVLSDHAYFYKRNREKLFMTESWE